MTAMTISTSIPLTSSLAFGETQSARQYEAFSLTTYTILPPPKLQFGLFGTITPGWKIIRPLIVTIEQDEDGFYIASDDEFLIYGYGKTQFLAQQDYITSLIEYYQLLEKQRDLPTQEMFRYLQSYLVPI